MKKIRINLKKNKYEEGQSLVEFAVSLVVILLILAGVCDLGRMFFYYIAMRDAAQEGVLYGSIVFGDDELDNTIAERCSLIETRAQELLSGDADVSVLVNGVDCSSADEADACNPNTIQVDIIDEDFMLEMPFFGGRAISLDASANGTILRPECD